MTPDKVHHNGFSENLGTEALETIPDQIVASEPASIAPVVTDGSAFDLDGDGHVGGSRPKASRQRKPGGR